MTENSQLYTDLTVATMGDSGSAYGLIENAAIVTQGAQIAWVGAREALPGRFASLDPHSLAGRLVTPGLIDCHTHIVHGGNRAAEFERRLNGASYAEIARAGGGILATVAATRAASQEALIASALPRLDALLAEGVCVVEVKSGYGLEAETELVMLRAARALERQRPVRIVTSFLGAHALPAEYKGGADSYIDEVCIPALRAARAEGLVDAVDGFCEGIAFTPAQIARVFDVARDLGLPVRLHAEQLSNLGGAEMAARHGALSADHLEYLDEDGVRAMADAGTIAVLLPGAFYTLREAQAPPIAGFRAHGVAMALASDCNPGSSPMTSLLLAMNMGCTLFRLTPEEALAGVTRHAAAALGLKDCGEVAAGKRADLAVWNVTHPAELAYRIGFNPLQFRICAGTRCAH